MGCVEVEGPFSGYYCCEHDYQTVAVKYCSICEGAECDSLKQRYAKLVKAISVAECLPGCDAYGHEEKCPNASVAERLVAAEAECTRLKQELDALKAERD